MVLIRLYTNDRFSVGYRVDPIPGRGYMKGVGLPVGCIKRAVLGYYTQSCTWVDVLRFFRRFSGFLFFFALLKVGDIMLLEMFFGFCGCGWLERRVYSKISTEQVKYVSKSFFLENQPN